MESADAESLVADAVKLYADTVYRVALHITCNSEDAFDVSQDVFLRLVKSREKIKDESHLKAWLIRVAVNCARSFMKQKSRRSAMSLDEIRESELVELPQDGMDLVIQVMKLPDKYSTVIYLYYYEDMPVSEIASTLGISQSAVKLRLLRGREKLKYMLEEVDKNGNIV